jgi:hypothetical protein
MSAILLFPSELLSSVLGELKYGQMHVFIIGDALSK